MPAACRSAALFWASLEKAPPGSTSAPIFTINFSYEGTRNLFLPTEAANLCRIGVPDMHMKFHFYRRCLMGALGVGCARREGSASITETALGACVACGAIARHTPRACLMKGPGKKAMAE